MYILTEVTDMHSNEFIGVDIWMSCGELAASLRGGLALMVTTMHTTEDQGDISGKSADAYLSGVVTAIQHCAITGRPVVAGEDPPINVKLSDVCDHKWIDARNAVVKSGEMCLKCGAVSAGNVLAPEVAKEPGETPVFRTGFYRHPRQAAARFLKAGDCPGERGWEFSHDARTRTAWNPATKKTREYAINKPIPELEPGWEWIEMRESKFTIRDGIEDPSTSIAERMERAGGKSGGDLKW